MAMEHTKEDLRVAREIAEGVLDNTPAKYEVLASAFTAAIASMRAAEREKLFSDAIRIVKATYYTDEQSVVKALERAAGDKE